MNRETQRRLELLETKARKLRVSGQRSSVNSEINVTPLVDVVLVLLIIFMLILPKISIVIDLPKQLSPEKTHNTKDAITLTIKKDKTLFVNDVKIKQPQLQESLKSVLRGNPLRRVLLSADSALEFREIRALLSTLREVGITEADLMGKRILEE